MAGSNPDEEGFCLECFVLETPTPSRPWSVLVQGPPKVGKSMFCRNFVKGARKAGRDIVYVTTDEAPDQLRDELTTILGEWAGIRIVDCYSWRLGPVDRDRTFAASSANLSELSITLHKAMEDLDRPTVVIDTVSSLALDASEEACLKCVRMLAPKVKMKKGAALFTVSEGLHSPSFQNALRTIFDAIIEMKVEEQPEGIDRLVRVFAARAPSPIGGWTRFSVTEKGIRIGTPLFRGKIGIRHIPKILLHILGRG